LNVTFFKDLLAFIHIMILSCILVNMYYSMRLFLD